MQIKSMQKQVDDWIKTKGKGYWPPLSMLARLAEETGELARVLNHICGSKTKKSEEVHKDIREELGDLLFTIICISNAFNIDLEEAYNITIKKSKIRDENRF